MVQVRTKMKKKISELLAKENGSSIAVLYHDVEQSFKKKYLPYNNIKHLKVYSILILDYNKWTNEILKTIGNNKKELTTCLQFFKHYNFEPIDKDEWNCSQWRIKTLK